MDKIIVSLELQVSKAILVSVQPHTAPSQIVVQVIVKSKLDSKVVPESENNRIWVTCDNIKSFHINQSNEDIELLTCAKNTFAIISLDVFVSVTFLAGEILQSSRDFTWKLKCNLAF